MSTKVQNWVKQVGIALAATLFAAPAWCQNVAPERPARAAAGAAAEAARETSGAAADTVRNAAGAAAGAARGAADAARDTAGAAAAASGFNVQTARPADVGLWFDGAANDGLVISDVSSNGAIASLGFQAGDRVVSVNGQQVANQGDFMNYLFADDVRDQRVGVVIDRAGREQTIQVEPSALVQEYDAPPQQDPLQAIGIVLDDRYDDRALVWKVERRSPAFYGGVRPGDVIVGVNNQRVQTSADLVQAVTQAEGEQLTFQVSRGEQTRRVQVDVVTVPAAPQAVVPAPSNRAPAAAPRRDLTPRVDLLPGDNRPDRPVLPRRP